ncbi:DUF2271 domain-containing protein [bacterium]|nr:DUF2271 domain-containing protein [bacterium]RQV96365.1 MAG: DUF2271 domain-containing protein [bacterium]
MKRMTFILIILGFAVMLNGQQKSFETFISEAQDLKTKRQFQEAVDLLLEAVEIYPNESNVHLQLGLAWGDLAQQAGETNDMMLAMKGVNEAFAEFEKAVQLDPDHFEAHLNYGAYGVNVPALFGKLDQGVLHLEKAASLLEKIFPDGNPEVSGVIYRFLGQGYQMQERLEEARTAWEKVLEFTPDNENGLAAQEGLENLKQGKANAEVQKPESKQESPEIVVIKQKIEKSQGDFQLHLALGKTYMEEKHWADAQQALKQAIRIDPNSIEAQRLLVNAIGQDAVLGYDERIYEDQELRTNLAFEVIRQMERLLELDPHNPEYQLEYGLMCTYMPFFVQKIDQGLDLLESLANDSSLPDSIRTEALYGLGFGLRKKGTAIWMQLVQNYPKTEDAQLVYEEYGLREHGKEQLSIHGEKVLVTFHLGFQDEIEPQTAVWVEDASGRFVKTLYVSGFSGFAKEKQVNLPIWANNSRFETDGTTGASIDWGKHNYTWNLKDHDEKRVPSGLYKITVETSWWPSMTYGRVSADIHVGNTSDEKIVESGPPIPLLHVQYIK